jgi:hypothetical protein
MRQLAHIFYAIAFVYLGSLSGPIEWSEPVPEFDDLRRQIWAGEANTADRPGKITFGRTHLEQLLESVNRARFQESLSIVAAVR